MNQLEVSPLKKVFISYSRWNEYIARQLYADLERMGCSPWMDRSDIVPNTDWSKSIQDNIRSADAVLLLWSPEAEASPNVREEMELASQVLTPDRITRLRVAGNEKDMPIGISRIQDIDFTQGYWDALPKLAERLSVERPGSSKEVFEDSALARDAFASLKNDSGKSWSARAGGDRFSFISIPWLPSGYGMSWRVLEKDAELQPPTDLFVVLKFTAEAHRDPLQETLDFLRSGTDEKFSEFKSPFPQFLLIEGPKRDMVYEITNDKPLQWKDSLSLCEKAIGMIGNGPHLHFFLYAPQALTFPLASRLRGYNSFDVYNLERKTGGLFYRRVYSTKS